MNTSTKAKRAPGVRILVPELAVPRFKRGRGDARDAQESEISESPGAPVARPPAPTPRRRRTRPDFTFAGLDAIRARLKRCQPLTPEDEALFTARFEEARAAGTKMQPIHKSLISGCPAAVPTGTGRCKCSLKGCGCSDKHALRADAVCPLGRWPV